MILGLFVFLAPLVPFLVVIRSSWLPGWRKLTLFHLGLDHLVRSNIEKIVCAAGLRWFQLVIKLFLRLSLALLTLLIRLRRHTRVLDPAQVDLLDIL